MSVPPPLLSLSLYFMVSRIDVAGHMHGETMARDLAIFRTDSRVAGVRSFVGPSGNGATSRHQERRREISGAGWYLPQRGREGEYKD